MISTPSPCPDRLEDIAELVMGILPASQGNELQKHLDTCPACSRFAQTLRNEENKLRDIFDRAALTVKSQTLPAKRSTVWTRAGRLALAAGLLLGMVTLLFSVLPENKTSPAAFAQVLDYIRTAQAVSYKMTIQMVRQPAMEEEIIRLEPGRSRTCSGTGITQNIRIDDFIVDKSLSLFPNIKRAYLTEYVGREKSAGFEGMFESLKKMQEDSGKALGLETLENQTVQVYRSVDAHQEATFWVDVQTCQPVKIQIKTQPLNVGNFKTVASTWTFTDIVWNPPIDERLFSLVPPEGYTCEQTQVDLSPPQETHLVEALRIWTDQTGGAFPDRLDRSAMPDFGMKIKEGPTAVINLDSNSSLGVGQCSTESNLPESEVKAALEARHKITKGLLFVDIQIGSHAGWRYAGAGVRWGDAGRIVCWWKPRNADMYRAIYGDLAIRDVYADQLPVLPADPTGQPTP